MRKDMATLALEESIALGVLERREAAGTMVKVVAVRVTPALVGDIGRQFGKTEKEVQTWQDAVPLCERPLHLRPGGQEGYAVTAEPKVAEGELGKFALTWWREPVTPKAAAICGRYDDLKVRMALVYSGMADWNCRSHQMYEVLALPYHWAQMVAEVKQAGPEVACGAPTLPLPPEVGISAWQSHETAVAITSSVVAGFLLPLPLALGCLGGCAYAMRRIDQKLSTWTLEPQDGRHAIVRVALAAVLGGLVGVVWTSGDTVTLGGFSLSLAAAAFFIGFSVEPVFKVIENLVIETLIKKATPAAEKKAGGQ